MTAADVHAVTDAFTQARSGITNMRSLRTGSDLVVRTSLLLAVGIALFFRILPASGQFLTGVDTDPFASTVWISAGNDAD